MGIKILEIRVKLIVFKTIKSIVVGSVWIMMDAVNIDVDSELETVPKVV